MTKLRNAQTNLASEDITITGTWNATTQTAGDNSTKLSTTAYVDTGLSGKEPTLTKGNLTEASSSVLTITGGASSVIGTGTSLQVKQANASQDGYISATDWALFNSKGTSSNAASGVNFFLDDTAILPINVQNSNEVNTLNRYPVTTTEVLDTIVVNNNTILKEAYLYATTLGGTQIDPGEWNFYMYCGVDNASGTTQILVNVYQVINTDGMTIAMTGPGTTRLADVTGGTPFIFADDNVNIANCSYLQTPKGLYAISAFSTTAEVTMIVPGGYINESGVSFKIWRKLFQYTTGDINTLAPTLLIATPTNSAQSSFSLGTLDLLGIITFGTTTRATNTTITYSHNGNTRYSYFSTPLLIRHNDTAGLQGGSAAERYHLTSAAYGYLSSQNQSVYTTSDTTFGSSTLSNLTASSLVGSDSLKKLVTITALPNGTTATTQTAGDSSTKVASTAYADTAITNIKYFNKSDNVIYSSAAQYSLDLGIASNGGANFNGAQYLCGLYQDAAFYNTFSTSTTADFGLGTLTPANSTGGAAVSDGYLDLAHNDARSVGYYGYYNADMSQILTLKFIWKPNYNNSPASDQYLFSIYASSGSNVSYIYLKHDSSTGKFLLPIYNSGGSAITTGDFGAIFVASSGTDYEIEIDIDITNGATRLFVNGSQAGSTITATGTRASNAIRLRIGSDRSSAATSNFSMKNFIVYRTIQHTANYTAGYTLSAGYVYINNSNSYLMQSLSIMDSTPNVLISLNTQSNSYIKANVNGEAKVLTLINTKNTANKPTSLIFGGENNSSTIYDQAKWSANNTVVTAGSETSEFICSVMNAGTLTEFMRIDDNFNLGIGTTNANDGKLHIVENTGTASTTSRALRVVGGKDALAQAYFTGAQYGINVTTNSGEGTYYAAYFSGSSTGSGSLTVYNDGTIRNTGATIFHGETPVTAGTYNSLSVSGLRAFYIEPSGSNIVINGFADGVAGQEIVLYTGTGAAAITIVHNNASGTQKILCFGGVNFSMHNNSGLILRFNGTYWYTIVNAAS